MEEELFGPIVTIYVYNENKMEETLDTLDNTSIYGLTGAIFSQDRYEIDWMTKRLEQTAGNFYVNDKAGSYTNLLRWVSMRSIKENFNPPKDYRYPFLEEE